MSWIEVEAREEKANANGQMATRHRERKGENRRERKRSGLKRRALIGEGVLGERQCQREISAECQSVY